MPHPGGRLAQAEGRAASPLDSCSKWRRRMISRSSSSSIVDGLAEPPLQLATERRGGRRGAGVAELARPGRSRSGRRTTPSRQRSLAVDAPRTRPPGACGGRRSRGRWAICRSHRWNGSAGMLEVVGQPAARLEHHLLDHVAGVDPTAHRAVEPQADHPPERLAVPLPEPPLGRRVGPGDAVEEVRVSAGSGHMVGPDSLRSPPGSKHRSDHNGSSRWTMPRLRSCYRPRGIPVKAIPRPRSARG